MAVKIGWGILGTGTVAGDFAQGLRHLPDARLAAVGSRSRARAEEFASAFAAGRAYAGYEEVVQDKDVDVVYVTTPNHKHRERALLALEAGKPVLCDKPFTVTAPEAREVIAAARRARLFCMEAMWMRFLPLIARLRGLLNAGAIGEIRAVTAELGFPTPVEANCPLFDPEMGGGAMLDLGIYPLSLASYLLGRPTEVTSRALIGATGVDEQSVAVLGYPEGKLAVVSASLRASLSNEALVIGDRGQIRLHAPLYRPHRLSLTEYPAARGPSGTKRSWQVRLRENRLLRAVYFRFEDIFAPVVKRGPKKIVEPFQGNGYNYEATEVMRCLRAGELESKTMPLDETFSIMETMDAVRQGWGCRRP